VTAEAAEGMKQTPMYELYARLAPRIEDWPRLLRKLGEGMALDFDFTKDVARIKARTLIVAGDADIFPPAHAVEVFASWRWEARRGMGRFRTPEVATRHPPWCDALLDGDRTRAARDGHPVPR
jgi:pimeloyl-ACP methyl ester carboxylesterase